MDIFKNLSSRNKDQYNYIKPLGLVSIHVGHSLIYTVYDHYQASHK